MERRALLKWLLGTAAGVAAAETLDVERLLWVPGAKTILLPSVRQGAATDPMAEYWYRPDLYQRHRERSHAFRQDALDRYVVATSGDGEPQRVFTYDADWRVFGGAVYDKDGRWAREATQAEIDVMVQLREKDYDAPRPWREPVMLDLAVMRNGVSGKIATDDDLARFYNDWKTPTPEDLTRGRQYRDEILDYARRLHG